MFLLLRFSRVQFGPQYFVLSLVSLFDFFAFLFLPRFSQTALRFSRVQFGPQYFVLSLVSLFDFFAFLFLPRFSQTALRFSRVQFGPQYFVLSLVSLFDFFAFLFLPRFSQTAFVSVDVCPASACILCRDRDGRLWAGVEGEWCEGESSVGGAEWGCLEGDVTGVDTPGTSSGPRGGLAHTSCVESERSLPDMTVSGPSSAGSDDGSRQSSVTNVEMMAFCLGIGDGSGNSSPVGDDGFSSSSTRWVTRDDLSRPCVGFLPPYQNKTRVVWHWTK